MIKPSADPGWFNVSPDVFQQCRLVPGGRARQGYLQLHQTHLPLVEASEAARLCAAQPTDFDARALLDRMTNERGGFQLRHYQHEAVEFVNSRTRGALIGDEPRLGKTITALMTHDPTRGRLVVVAPLMVREVWLSWIRRLFPGEDVGLMVGKQFDKQVASKPIVVGHPGLLATWATDLPVGTLILDEIHDYSTHKSRRSIGASMIASRAQRVLGLTGTPVWNKVIGMWFILSLLEPGAFGSYEAFGQRYCEPLQTAWGVTYKGSTNSDELSRRLTQIMIRRRHSEVKADLPPMSRETIIADITPTQRRQIDLAAEGLRKSAFTSTAGEIARYRAVIGAAKVDTTVEYGLKLIRRGEPIVVWAWHKKTAKLLEAAFAQAGAKTYLVTGDVTPIAQREARLSAWRADEPAVLVITIAVGQVGIDLSHARYALMVEIDYTPALMMRVFHIDRPSYITYIIVDHMTDRRVIETLMAKLVTTRGLDLQAAESAINILHAMFQLPLDTGDMDRLMRAMLAYEEGVV